MTRAEHVAWCKKRALEYGDKGELGEAYASMISDMQKHPEIKMLPILIAAGAMEIQRGAQAVRHWIEGFN
jgi:hypothetical protein